VGVPRHNKQWLRRLRATYGSGPHRGKYIFVASRPVHKTNFPPAKKAKAMRDLKTLANQLECALVVRPHPAETEVDRDIIESTLDREWLGKTWSYSALPALVAAQGA